MEDFNKKRLEEMFGYTPEDKHFNLYIIHLYCSDGLWWFRWFKTGSGFLLKDTSKIDMIFSERNGHGIKYGKWLIKKLRKIK